jgi:pimeloyl-[acyl-carrier protein] methyl ester esterase
MTKEKHFYLIRGLIREKEHWGRFPKELQNAFPGARITAIDIPGAGEYFNSSTPLTIRGIVEKMRQDYLRHKTEDGSIHLIAVSLGGMIAVEWMKRYPSDFQEATLINTSLGGISPFFHRLLPKALLFLMKVPLLNGRSKESRILELVTNHKNIFHETLDRWELIQRERPVSLDNTLRQLFAAANFSAKHFIPPIPITLIASTTDRMVSVECSRAIARIWKSTLLEHPTGGHDLSVDDPEWLAQMIKETTTVF